MTETDNKVRILRPFSLAPSKVVTVEVGFELSADQIKVFYLLTGELGALRIAPLRASRRASRLWEHTCFELFVGMAGDPGYYEFNFSPSTEWAALAFRDYRDGAPLDDDGMAPAIATRLQDRCLELAATVNLDRLALVQPCASLRLGLSAVIEEIGGALSYWALKHPSDKPDFHHQDSFALELALPQKSA